MATVVVWPATVVLVVGLVAIVVVVMSQLGWSLINNCYCPMVRGWSWGCMWPALGLGSGLCVAVFGSLWLAAWQREREVAEPTNKAIT